MYRNKNQSFNNISSFVYMFAFYYWKPVTNTKANSKKNLATSKLFLDADFISYSSIHNQSVFFLLTREACAHRTI